MDIFIRKYSAILSLLLCVVLLVPAAETLAKTPVESKVKAAFVVNFARFISWPKELFRDPSEPLVICTVGVEETDFSGVETKYIKGRPIVLKNINSLEEPLGICHLLYFEGVSGKSLQEYLKNSGPAPVVSVSESDGFANLGGTIEFIKVKDRLSFKINNTRAKEKRLQIDASLLNLAFEVY